MWDDLAKGLSHYPTTQWSTVVRAKDEDGESRRQALSRLLTRYMPALRAYLLRGMRISEDRAQDLLQSFVSDKILEQNLVARADPARGRFRAFLRTALENYVRSVLRRDQTAKRLPPGGTLLPIDERKQCLADRGCPTDAFDVAWARQLLADVLKCMEADCREQGRADVWGVFEGRMLRPILQQADPAPYEVLVEQFEFESPAKACNALVTAKRMFMRILRSLIGETVTDERLVEEEIRELKAVLLSAGA